MRPPRVPALAPGPAGPGATAPPPRAPAAPNGPAAPGPGEAPGEGPVALVTRCGVGRRDGGERRVLGHAVELEDRDVAGVVLGGHVRPEPLAPQRLWSRVIEANPNLEPALHDVEVGDDDAVLADNEARSDALAHRGSAEWILLHDVGGDVHHRGLDLLHRLHH